MITKRWARRAAQKPTAARLLGLFAGMVAGLIASGTSNADTWTLATARERAFEDGRFEALVAASANEEAAAGRAALPWSNPILGYQREQTFGGSAIPGGLAFSGTSEDFLWIGQTFDFSFRRGLLEEAGGRRAAAARLMGQARRRDAELMFEQLYMRALAETQGVAAFDRWVARLQGLAERTRAREQSGDASRYDVLRIERERISTSQRREQRALRLTAVVAELATWLGDTSGAPVFEGTLPPPPPKMGEAPSDLDTRRPLQALALEHEAGALSLEQQAAERWFLPPVTTTVGGKTVFGHHGLSPQVGELGYQVSVQVPIPAFNRGSARREQLGAAKRVATARAQLQTVRVRQRAASARAVWGQAMTALEEHRVRASERNDQLAKTARAAWLGGELSLLALLEAERTILDDELAEIELAHTARHAQLAHAALTLEASP